MTTATKPRNLIGILKSRRAILAFLSGCSKRTNFRCFVLDEHDEIDRSARLRPYECSLRQWYCDELNEWVNLGDTPESAQYLDAARRGDSEGQLTLRCWEDE